jgi:simple sugar transport system permease protein
MIEVPELGALLAFSSLMILFLITAGPLFFSVYNITSMLTRVSEVGIVTIGISFLMISGEFDLSVSGVYALSGYIFISLANQIFSLLALILTLLLAAFVGLLNGLITRKGRIPSFITTLGMMLALKGLLLGITKGQSIVYRGDSFAPSILTQLLPFDFRPEHIWFLSLIVVFTFILRKTRYGNWTYATGGNEEFARTMGVNVERVKIINFIISATLAGFSGIIVITRFKTANVSFGMGLELEAISAAVIGGTFLQGGIGTIIGAGLGAALVATVRIGLVMSGAPGYWYQTFVGGILIAAAIINQRLSKLRT